MAAPLRYLLITVNAIDLQKVSVSDMQILKTLFQHIEADGKYSLLNTDNLTQPIEMELSQKQKTFGTFFLCILKI